MTADGGLVGRCLGTTDHKQQALDAWTAHLGLEREDTADSQRGITLHGEGDRQFAVIVLSAR
ncbi:hypothetical protein OOK44_36175 [Streptomyces cellulosae]|uniref:Glyoxalase-like domain-containing protein n=1 Tax=Streptomyces althioticus TaxID=83380 RepID=A0ABZ1YFK9_9ACTN|nr:hypothetical protein [Streptomyces cellulosae]WTB93441.1 hypothetical protein OIE99_34925 [Streptomyces cellulosae]WTC60832.1 hypothetical protein OH715_36675 [Streptomyces cellulosae]